MRLVVTDSPLGPWHQLIGETPLEWEALDALAVAGHRTSGRGLEAEAQLVALVAGLGVPLHVVRGRDTSSR